MNKRYWISRRVLGRVHPEVFFTTQGFQGEKGVCNHDHRYVMVPSLPVATFVVIQAEFFFELVLILLDLPTAFEESYDTSQGVVSRKVA